MYQEEKSMLNQLASTRFYLNGDLIDSLSHDHSVDHEILLKVQNMAPFVSQFIRYISFETLTNTEYVGSRMRQIILMVFEKYLTNSKVMYTRSVISNVLHQLKTIQCLAAHLLYDIQQKELYNEWIVFLLRCRDEDYLHRTSAQQQLYCNHLKRTELLEHGGLLISRFLSDKDGIGDTNQSNVSDDAVITLNHIAQKLRDRLQSFEPLHNVLQRSTTTHHCSRFMSEGTVYRQKGCEGLNPGGTYTMEYVKNAVTILHTIITDEIGALGNYFNFRNSSIALILTRSDENRVKGIPITIAIIYKLILSRVNIHTEIIGLPGHVVLGIPINKNIIANMSGTQVSHQSINTMTNTGIGRIDTFVDVYNDCRFLSKSDCQGIVQQNSVRWNDSYILPLSTSSTVLRMVFDISGKIYSLLPHLLPLGGLPHLLPRDRIKALRRIMYKFSKFISDSYSPHIDHQFMVAAQYIFRSEPIRYEEIVNLYRY